MSSSDNIAVDDITFTNCGYDVGWPCEFVCLNNNCIPNSRKCDYSDDCGDNSDETDCGMSLTLL